MSSENATSPQTSNTADGTIGASASANQNWSSALVTLLSSRISIICTEARIAAESTARKVALAAIAGLTVFLFWIILMAGLIGFIPTLACSLAWYHVALIIAGLHLLVALIAILLLRKKSPPPFSITRTEFQKDRQWLSKTKESPISEN